MLCRGHSASRETLCNCRIRWEFSAEQHWVLWPYHRQLGSSGLHGNPALWRWCVCSPRKVTVILTPAGASDYSKEQFVGESRILSRMFIPHCVHRGIPGTSAEMMIVLVWCTLSFALVILLRSMGGAGTPGKRMHVWMWETRSWLSVVWGALSYCF